MATEHTPVKGKLQDYDSNEIVHHIHHIPDLSFCTGPSDIAYAPQIRQQTFAGLYLQNSAPEEKSKAPVSQLVNAKVYSGNRKTVDAMSHCGNALCIKLFAYLAKQRWKCTFLRWSYVVANRQKKKRPVFLP